ncbi:luciferin sulfotransferase-like [Bacillus rossius redtenbacheri]|uniref:luciferin sulfotransferase-like n=1 Tax=Bacillus rossius redtenbacheri TaxID=93214 RepID=UPI002FDE161E
MRPRMRRKSDGRTDAGIRSAVGRSSGAAMYRELQEEDGPLERVLLRDFAPEFRPGYVRAQGALVPRRFADMGDLVRDLGVRDDDTWVVSFPKTGTTWTQEMVWCIANDLDFEGAKVPLPERFPFLDHSALFDYTDILPKKPDLRLPGYVLDSVGHVADLPGPRFVKTHLPWSLLPRQIRDTQRRPKIIYVARNPKDTCVSYYHHCKLLEGYQGDFDDFCKLFLGDTLCFSPFWSHVLAFWERRSEPNILFLKYEDMKKDLPSVIRRTADFLERKLSDEDVDVLAEHLSFDSMRKNRSVNYEEVVEINRNFGLIPAEGQFMRAGRVGEWRAAMSPELVRQFDAWTEEHLAGTGLSF